MSESQSELSRSLMVAIRVHQNASDMMDEAMTSLLGVNRTDGRCLDIIDLRRKITPGELATETGLTTGAMTAVIDRLEKAGYVSRGPHPGDRRKVVVQLTPEAAEIGELIYGQMGRLGRTMMGGMSADQMRTVLKFLDVGTRMSRQMAELVDRHVPDGPISATERLARARAINEDQTAAADEIQAQLSVDRPMS